jgi:hypothetical protein
MKKTARNHYRLDSLASARLLIQDALDGQHLPSD